MFMKSEHWFLAASTFLFSSVTFEMTATSFSALKGRGTSDHRLITPSPIFVSHVWPFWPQHHLVTLSIVSLLAPSVFSFTCVSEGFSFWLWDWLGKAAAAGGYGHHKTLHPRTSPHFGCCISTLFFLLKTSNYNACDVSSQQWSTGQVFVMLQQNDSSKGLPQPFRKIRRSQETIKVV